MEKKFNGAELRLARIFNGLSLEDVAEQVEVTRQYVHKLETGLGVPNEFLIQQLASVLGVTTEFLCGEKSQAIAETQFNFRKQFSTKAFIKQMTMARCEFVERIVGFLDQELKLPELSIPDLSYAKTPDEIEKAAELCRQHWDLGLGPIDHMSRLVENLGVIVTNFESFIKEVDALSVAVKRPIIVRNKFKESVCRQRFDLAHELGHFVLHTGIETGDRITENQANRFASAFLIPRTMMAKLFPKPKGSRLDWNGLKEFKMTWKVSKAAILFRARQLDLLTDGQYRTGVITLSRNGQTAGEWEDHLISSEEPELLTRSFHVLAEKKNIFTEDIAKALCLTPEIVSKIVGFQTPSRPVEIRSSRPLLYAVS